MTLNVKEARAFGLSIITNALYVIVWKKVFNQFINLYKKSYYKVLINIWPQVLDFT